MPQLTISAVKTRAVLAPLARPITTAVASIEKAPLLLIDLETREGFPRYTLATLYTNTGDLERILDLLELSAARREPELARLRAPDAFAGLRHHPRVRKILDDLESGDER